MCSGQAGPPAKLVKRTARGVVLAAEPGPSGRRNADIAATGVAEGGNGPALHSETLDGGHDCPT